MREYIEKQSNLPKQWRDLSSSLRIAAIHEEDVRYKDKLLLQAKVYEQVAYQAEHASQGTTIIRIYYTDGLRIHHKDVLLKLDKYPTSTVELDDAARKIASNIRVARSRAAGLKMKKDDCSQAHFQGEAEAGCEALRALGYTDEQIEVMLK